MPAVPNSNVDCNAFSTDVTEAASANSSSSTSTPLLLLGLFNVLYLLGPPIFKWRFPCQSTDELDAFASKLEDLIENNSSLERDVLGDSSEVFRTSLEELNKQANKIRNFASSEPARSNPLAWVKFQWALLNDVDSCYISLKRLKGEVEAKIRDEEKTD
ncbi:hypothetical protein Moror_5636 [Moniliophthora roreri MCA 2997]|uniref:Uncharacterized protein n=2 Tax=Moniliophthora roreri TaxID=221103 RepID=V2W7I7_MONRO|nr:hypothetical protein Moror_5636 [Moniliophthora roreri MCA 2997]KAI3620813.1 hypothetical protein WG66_011362 [Moniliophthora roreri]